MDIYPDKYTDCEIGALGLKIYCFDRGYGFGLISARFLVILDS